MDLYWVQGIEEGFHGKIIQSFLHHILLVLLLPNPKDFVILASPPPYA